jgi:hypothetical protein
VGKAHARDQCARVVRAWAVQRVTRSARTACLIWTRRPASHACPWAIWTYGPPRADQPAAGRKFDLAGRARGATGWTVRGRHHVHRAHAAAAACVYLLLVTAFAARAYSIDRGRAWPRGVASRGCRVGGRICDPRVME